MIALLPVPRKAFYYDWGSDPVKREDYLVLGFVQAPPEPGGIPPLGGASALYHSTWLLVIRSDGKATYLGMDQLTFEELP